MVQCCVLGCHNRTEQGLCDITFHRFPVNENKLMVWIAACGRPNWTPTKNSRICSKHFDSNCISKRGNKTFLIPNALPTKDVHVSTETRVSEATVSLENLDNTETVSIQHRESDVETLDPKERTSKRKLTQEDTPRKKKLRKVAENRLLKLRAVRQAKRRVIKRNEKLSNILLELKTKCYLSFEDVELLGSIDTINRDFLKRFTGVEAKNTRYTPSLRKFALCLHFLSPRAYCYVREQFNTCLPHPKTLTNWYRSIDGNPGFTKESLEAIKLKTQGIDKKIYVSLSFDEMAIRKGVSMCNGEFFGTVNIGTNIDSDEARLANQALVFMATALNDSWKIPVGYFLIESLSGEQKAELTKKCIVLLTQSGVEVVTVTCDGCPSNFAMARILGCKIDCHDPNDLITEFMIDVDGLQKSIYFYPDPPHMLKLLRNILGDKDCILDMEGEIKWGFIKSLHQLQESEGLHLANKLRKSHIDFAKQIMKVRLAAQTFSNSVADAIDFCSNKLKLPEFQNSDRTTNFIRKINNLFDVLNSRNINAYGYKKPINKNNFEEINIFLNDMLIYLNSLKLPNGQKIVDTNRKTSIIGFSCVIRSLLCLYKRLIMTNSLLFLPAYKLCQDHLESFFSSIRAKGGFNSNPSPVQFKAAYKRLVVHGELKHVATGNCSILDNIHILTYTQSSYEKKINASISMLRDPIEMEESEILKLNTYEDASHDHDYLPDPSSITEYSKEVIAYIAGYIVRKISKSVKCADCLQSATDTSKTVGRLISQKDKGGLCFPSKDVIEICLLTEKVFKRNLKTSESNLMRQKNVQKFLLHEGFKMCSNKHFFQNHGNMFDNSPLDSHELLLTKAIIMEYLKIRLHYFAKCLSEPAVKIRNMYNKLILFKNQ